MILSPNTKLILKNYYLDNSNYGNLSDMQFIHTLENFSCGDKITIGLNISHNTTGQLIISSARFESLGCMVSKASTALLIEKIQSAPLTTVAELKLTSILDSLLLTEETPRIKCISIGLETIHQLLNSKEVTMLKSKSI